MQTLVIMTTNTTASDLISQLRELSRTQHDAVGWVM